MTPANIKTRNIFQFPDRCFIENIAIRPNDHILVTTFRKGELYNINPNASTPEAQLVARLPGVDALTGIVQVAHDVWAIAGGIHPPQPFVFDKGSMKVFRVDLNAGISNPSIENVADAVDAPLLNGMCGIPRNPHILLSVDSHGKVWRIDMKTRKVDAVLEHVELAPSEEGERVSLGANGAKIFGEYLYWTNSARETFCRVKVDDEGNAMGNVEVVARHEGGGEMDAYDDFDFDPTTGTAYITRHPNAVHAVDKDGNLSVFAGRGEEDMFQQPTALAVSKDGKKMYVASAGKLGEFCGYVTEVELPTFA